MPSPIDVYRTAQLLIMQHGPKASLQAAQRADRFNVAGDRVGFHLWRQVLAAVQELEDAKIPPGATRH